MSDGSLEVDPEKLKKSSTAVNHPAEVLRKALTVFDNQPHDRGRRGHCKLLEAPGGGVSVPLSVGERLTAVGRMSQQVQALGNGARGSSLVGQAGTAELGQAASGGVGAAV
jgi:hypothetical protein